MPRVPSAATAGLGQVEARPLAAPALPMRASPASFGATQAVQLGRLGLAGDEAGAVLGGIGLRQQALLDDSRVDDVKTREWDASRQQLLNNPETGALTRLGGSAIGVTKELAATLAARREEIAKGLDNDVQRQLFLRRTAPELDSAMDALSRHEARELKAYRVNTNTAVIDGAANDALVSFTDPAVVQRSLGTIRSRTALNLEGLPPEAVAERERALVSGVHKAIVGRWLEREDPDGAARWLDANRSEVSGIDQGQLEGAIAAQRRQLDARRQGEARDAFIADVEARSRLDPLGTRAALSGGDLATAVEAVESGGDSYAVSPKGALGVMQLMPATAREAARDLGRTDLAGLADDQLKARLLDDPDLNRMLGRHHLDKMQRRYAGSQVLALAAYNAGQGTVDGWIAEHGDPRKGAISEAEWAERIPFAETRDYLRKVAARSSPTLQGPDDATTRRAQAYADQAAEAHLRRLEQEWAPMERLLAAGIEPTGIVELAQRAAGTPLEAGITAARQGQAEAAAFIAQPLSEQLGQLEAMRQRMQAEPTVGEAATYARLAKATGAIVEMVREDPLQAYARQTGVPLPELDGSADGYGRRRIVADRAAEWSGVPVSPLTGGEAAEVAKRLESGSVDERLAHIDALTSGFGEAAPALFGQLAPKAPVLAQVGRLAALGADVSTLRDILVGHDMVKSGDADKVVEATREDRARLADETLNQVLGPEMSAVRAQISAAADRLYLARATRARSAQTFDTAIYATALTEATGGRLDAVNGQLTLLPRDVGGDRVEQLLETMTPELWKFASVSGSAPLGRDGKPLPIDVLGDAYLEAVGDGLFLVNLQPRASAREYAAGGPDSGPFVLDLSRLVAATP